MPFTLAHPAAVIPLKRYLPLSALVVGSLSPDLEYLVRLRAVSHLSHTLTGLFSFCLPVGLVLLWLFHRFVKQPLTLLMPTTMRQRLLPESSNFPFSSLRNFALAGIAL